MNTEKILEAIQLFPGITAVELSTMLDEKLDRVCASLSYLYKRDMCKREGEAGGYKRPGYRYYPAGPKSNITPNRTPPTTSTPSGNPLSDYTPRQLLEELKRRGYVWDKMYVVTKQFVSFDSI